MGRNAFRLGYGSDTSGAAQTPVKEGDTTDRADALANLEARIPKFEAVIVQQIGMTAWQDWNDAPQVQSALLSVCYNYGHLPSHVADCAKSGDTMALADAVIALQADNAWVNEKRRVAEANLIASAA